MKVKAISIKKILNSAGNPAVEATVKTNTGKFSASTPAGTSAGSHEVALKGVDASIACLKRIKPMELGSMEDLIVFEKKLEKQKIDSLPLIFALMKAFSAAEGEEVWQNLGSRQKPYLLHKVAGGGKHATSTFPGIKCPEFQEFLIAVKTNSLARNIGIASKVHQLVGSKLKSKYLDLEGGWVSNLNNEETIRIIKEIIDRIKDEDGIKIELGLDVAASEFYEKGHYVYKTGNKSKTMQIEFVKNLIKKYKLDYVEDPLDEDDFAGFSKLTKSTNTKICGDDLVTTNPERLKTAHKKGAVNSVIVKPNQIGYFYKLVQFAEIAKKYKYTLVMSHRSQETRDDILTDLCVGLGCKYMKIGLLGDERLAKIKRLLKIFGD